MAKKANSEMGGCWTSMRRQLASLRAYAPFLSGVLIISQVENVNRLSLRGGLCIGKNDGKASAKSGLRVFSTLSFCVGMKNNACWMDGDALMTFVQPWQTS